MVNEIKSYGNGADAIAIQADVSKVSEIQRLFEDAKKAFGKLDIVMSNSGTESWDKTEEVTEEKFDHVFNLNARAQFFVGQAAFKHLEQNGRLILMSSIAAGLMGVKNHALYNASKMAVIGMIKAFATDFGVKGITVNGVAPGASRATCSPRTRGTISPADRLTGRRRRLRPSWPSTARSGDAPSRRMLPGWWPSSPARTAVGVNGKLAPESCLGLTLAPQRDADNFAGQVITISGGSSQ